MKHLPLALVLLLATAAHAQQPLPRPTTPVKYCLLYTLGFYFAMTNMRLDYVQNQRKEVAVQDEALTAFATAIEQFTSVPAALSYLDDHGWELVQAATLPADKNAQVGYLLRRRR